MRSERRLLVLTLGGVDSDELIRDVALLGNEFYATRESGLGETVEFERGAHGVSASFRGVAPIQSYI